MLSGGNVGTEWAVIMAAVLLDRRALTLRGVALAAILVLVRDFRCHSPRRRRWLWFFARCAA
jgi:hypothetical protein